MSAFDPKRTSEQRFRIGASPSPFLATELFAFSAAEMAFVTLMRLDEFAGIVIFLVGRAARIMIGAGSLRTRTRERMSFASSYAMNYPVLLEGWRMSNSVQSM